MGARCADRRGGGAARPGHRSSSTAEPPPPPAAGGAGHGPLRVVVSRTRPPAFLTRLERDRRRAGAARLGRRQGRRGDPRRGRRLRCTAAASTSGTRRRRSRWRSPPGCTRPGIDGSKLAYNQADPSLPDILICPGAARRAAAGCDCAAGCPMRPDRQPRRPARPTSPDPDPRPTTGVCLMAVTRSDYSLSQLDVLEAESIHVMREVAAEFERPVLLFSGGKDSIVMLALAERAFWPARIPFPVMHVDTGHNFTEVIEFRDRRVAEAGVRLVVASVQESIDAGPGRRGDRPVGQP